MCKFDIILYNESYRSKLCTYLRKIRPTNSDRYIEYCANTSCDEKPSFIVINEKNDIVGCHLNFTTKVCAKGEVKTIAWGHETYLDEDYRSIAGVEFVMTINCEDTVGIGLSEVNNKILKKLRRYEWMQSTFSYFYLNIFFPLSVLKKFFKPKLNPLRLDNIVKTEIIFRLIKKSEDIAVPNGGYWYGDSIEYDLIRDRNFLDYRFFNNVVFDYSVYEYHNDSGDSCYFVVRPILVKGIPAVSLVDYRYHGDPHLMDCIVNAVKIIALKNHIGVVYTIGGSKGVYNAFKSILCYKRLGECIIHKSLKPKPSDSISITPADADVDFNS